jgi:hypothetical protein
LKPSVSFLEYTLVFGLIWVAYRVVYVLHRIN